MKKKCNLREEWKIQIEQDIYEIEYEGFYDERNHFLTINGEKRKIDIPVEIRSRKYDWKPYKYLFEIDGLELTIFLSEEYIFLIACGIDVKRRLKFIPLKTVKRRIVINNANGILLFTLLFLGALLRIEYKLLIGILGVLSSIIIIERKRFEWTYGEEITWVKDEKGRIIQFKQDVEQIIGLKKDK